MIARTSLRRRGRTSVAVVVGCLLALAAVPIGAWAAGTTDSFTKTVTISRVNDVNGVNQVVDKRTVKVTAGPTKLLRNRQEISVSWSGAHPTGGIVGDQTSTLASNEEYPVVLMECRGVDSTSVPAAKRLSQQTCWTQTPDERFRYSASQDYPPYRVDRYGSAADHALEAGAPTPYPAACSAFENIAQHWVPFVGADGKVYDGGRQGCAGLPAEATSFGDSIVPSNTTYGVSDLNGNGSANFVVQTDETNASLGCSATVPCSLVVVPIMGISCDTSAVPSYDQAAATALCTRTGRYAPGETINGNSADQEDEAVSGLLWWSASNWRNRVSIPLTFATAGSVCDVVNDSAPIYVYGSEEMAQATNQWATKFCTDKTLFKFQHVQTGEPQAKNLLSSGGIDAAFVAAPPSTPYVRPVVHAPVALTGFAIVFKIDDKYGHPLTSLRLTPRLLAKLLTESYPGVVQQTHCTTVTNKDGTTTCVPSLNSNPVSIADDPEFKALNPDVPPLSASTLSAATTMLVMSSQSDVMTALTSYINADPAARAWLDGTKDQWGMEVNPAYRGISLPVDRWPLLDTYVPQQIFDNNGCPSLASPWLPLVASPQSAMATAGIDMQFDISTSQTTCVTSGNAVKLAAVGRQVTGQRFLLGLVTLADARQYQLPSASLQTDTGGTTFVGPTDAGLKAAAGLLAADKSGRTWSLPYASINRSAAGKAAYPGTQLVSMDVATSGVPKPIAARYATLLRFAAGAGQQPGPGNGQLPDGYLPMTAANGLGAEAAYTVRAAAAVEAQAGSMPALDAPPPGPPSSSGGSTPGGSSTGTSPGSGGGGTGSTGTGSTGGTTPSSSGSTTSPRPTPTASGTTTPAPAASLSSVRTVGVGAGAAALALPLFLLMALVAGLAAPVVIVVGRRRIR